MSLVTEFAESLVRAAMLEAWCAGSPRPDVLVQVAPDTYATYRDAIALVFGCTAICPGCGHFMRLSLFRGWQHETFTTRLVPGERN